MTRSLFSVGIWFGVCQMLTAQGVEPKFRAQEIDSKIEIGYGLAIADVQGDGKPDILLADKKQFVWYENPTWKKHVLAENLTEKDNVCIAAQDIDGDGKCEIAVGAEWNPSDTEKSGAVFYLIPPADRTQRWEAVKLHAEPTTHRMKWIKRTTGRYDLVVVPLHGRGNKNGEGAGVKVLAYQKPEDPKAEWATEVVSDDMHLTHNFDILPDSDAAGLVLGGREGLDLIHSAENGAPWKQSRFVNHTGADELLKGVGEVRRWPHQGGAGWAAIEPMHGNTVVLYTDHNGTGKWQRQVLDDSLQDGHALAIGDLLGMGREQVIVGWRSMSNRVARVGIRMYVPVNDHGTEWKPHVIDDNQMACEDLVLADLDGDGKAEIIASGRRTKNVKIYWNETGK